MIRVRFHANAEDPRPVNWPIKHPYWITGYGGFNAEMEASFATVVAYADNVAEVKRNWPDATEIDVHEDPANGYAFTERFPRPDWLA